MDTHQEELLEDVAVATVVSAVSLIAQSAVKRALQIESQPYRPPGILTTLVDPSAGYRRVCHILHGPEQYCFDTTRLKQPVLHELISTLKDKYGLTDGKVSAEEKVIIFLYHCAHNTTHRQLRFDY